MTHPSPSGPASHIRACFVAALMAAAILPLSGCLVTMRGIHCPRSVEVGQEFIVAVDAVVSGAGGGSVGIVVQVPDSMSFKGAWCMTRFGRKGVRRNARLAGRYQAERGHYLLAISDSMSHAPVESDSVRLFLRFVPIAVGEYTFKYALAATTGASQWMRVSPPRLANFAHMHDSAFCVPIEVRPVEKPGLYALQFSGARQYVSLPDTGLFALTLDSSFTVEMWMRSTAHDVPIVSTRPDDLTSAFPLEIRIDSYGAPEVLAADGGSVFAAGSRSHIADGAWHHIAVTYDADSLLYTTYIDGEQDARLRLPARVGKTRHPAPVLGSSPPGRRFFTGVIDELRWWSMARTKGQILTHKNLMMSGFEQGLVAWYPFETGEDSMVVNRAQNGGYTGIPMNRPKLVASSLPFTSEVLAFYAALEKDTVSMTWETFDEKTVESFEVERRTESGRYEVIAHVSPQRLSTGHQVYRERERFAARSVVYYRLRRNNLDGSVLYSEEFPIGAELFHNFVLGESYPEPFEEAVTIPFTLKDAAFVSLRVYDQFGRLVEELVSKRLAAGLHAVEFDGADLPAATYFYRLKTSRGVQTKKMRRVALEP